MTQFVNWVVANTGLIRAGLNYLSTDNWHRYHLYKIQVTEAFSETPDFWDICLWLAVLTTGNSCTSGEAGWDQVRHPGTSQMAAETCERATELSTRSSLSIVKIRYLSCTQNLTIRHPHLALCVLPAVKITFDSYHDHLSFNWWSCSVLLIRKQGWSYPN